MENRRIVMENRRITLDLSEYNSLKEFKDKTEQGYVYVSITNISKFGFHSTTYIQYLTQHEAVKMIADEMKRKEEDCNVRMQRADDIIAELKEELEDSKSWGWTLRLFGRNNKKK